MTPPPDGVVPLTLTPALLGGGSSGVDLPWFDVTDPLYGAVGDGVTDDTSAIQAALDAAFAVGGAVIFPQGSFLTGTLQWRFVSMIGTDRKGCTLIGKPSQDILHVPWTGASGEYGLQHPGWHLRDLGFRLDDSVNAAASFPQRGGVGNACIAIDFANGSVGSGFQPQPYQALLENLWLGTVSDLTNGQNNSCGMYFQAPPVQCRFHNIWISRFRYGYREHYPTSNLSSVDISPDHNSFTKIHFDHNERQMRLVNHDFTSMENVVMHGFTPLSGLETVDVTSLIRTSVGRISVNTLYIERHAGNPLTLTGNNHDFRHLFVFQDQGSAQAAAPPLLACNDSFFRNCNFGAKGTAQLKITGKRNTIEWYPVYMPGGETYGFANFVDDRGSGNQLVVLSNPSGSDSRHRALEASNLSQRVLHQRDATATLLGHVSPTFVSGGDLILNPREMFGGWLGNVEGGSSANDYSFVADATSEFGYVYRAVGGGFYFGDDTVNGTYAFNVGRFLPASKVRMYIRAKAASAGSQNIDVIAAPATAIASGTASWTTSYTTFSLDLDLSAVAAGTGLIVTAGGAGSNLDISSISFRPYFSDLLVASGVVQTSSTNKLGFFSVTPVVQPVANPDTSGATLAALETEVNQLKATLRSLGLLAP